MHLMFGLNKKQALVSLDLEHVLHLNLSVWVFWMDSNVQCYLEGWQLAVMVSALIRRSEQTARWGLVHVL